MSESTFGYDFTKWLICKRCFRDKEVWSIIPPFGSVASIRGAEFTTGAEALAAFASGGRA